MQSIQRTWLCCTLIRADSRFAPSQWETALLCNDVSHWLGASPESAPFDFFWLCHQDLLDPCDLSTHILLDCLHEPQYRKAVKLNLSPTHLWIVTLPVGKSSNCPSADEAFLRDMGKTTWTATQQKTYWFLMLIMLFFCRQTEAVQCPHNSRYCSRGIAAALREI